MRKNKLNLEFLNQALESNLWQDSRKRGKKPELILIQ